jgi:hypothetical protein
VLCQNIGLVIKNFFLNIDLTANNSKVLEQRDKLLQDIDAKHALDELAKNLNIKVPFI